MPQHRSVLNQAYELSSPALFLSANGGAWVSIPTGLLALPPGGELSPERNWRASFQLTTRLLELTENSNSKARHLINPVKEKIVFQSERNTANTTIILLI